MKLIYKYTIVPENIHEIPQAIILADNLGCNRIDFGYDSTVPQALKEREELRHQLTSEINDLIENSRIEIEKERLEWLGIL